MVLLTHVLTAVFFVLTRHILAWRIESSGTKLTEKMRRRQFVSSAQVALVFGVEFAVKPRSCPALTPYDAAAKYDIYAESYDQLDGGRASEIFGIDQARTTLIQQANGKVLEIGVGTGLNLDRYKPEQVKSLTLVDISEGMLQEAKIKAKSLPNLHDIRVEFLKADATSELLRKFGDEAFDCVVDTFSLCVMGNNGAQKCLNEISQVVKKGGEVLLLENCRSSNAMIGLYQDITADAAALAGGRGCVYNQDIEAMIQATDRLKIEKSESYSAGLFRSFFCVRYN